MFDDAFKDGVIFGAFLVATAVTLFSLGHWIGRTSAEKRIAEWSRQSHHSEALEAREGE